MRVMIVPPGKREDGTYWVDIFSDKIGHLFSLGAEQSHGQFTAHELAVAVATGQDRMWTFWSDDMSECYGGGSVILADWAEGDTKIAVIRWIAGKEINKWKHFLETEIIPWVKEQGATKLVSEGRKGLAKVLPDWKIRSYVYEKDLL